MKQRLTKEKKAPKHLNKDMVILAADKGNATTVLKTINHEAKMRNLLHSATYKILPQKLTAKISRTAKSHIETSSLPSETQRNIPKSEALPPLPYGYPGIHKPSVPLGPILHNRFYKIQPLQVFTSLLQPHVGSSSSSL